MHVVRSNITRVLVSRHTIKKLPILSNIISFIYPSYTGNSFNNTKLSASHIRIALSLPPLIISFPYPLKRKMISEEGASFLQAISNPLEYSKVTSQSAIFWLQLATTNSFIYTIFLNVQPYNSLSTDTFN